MGSCSFSFSSISILSRTFAFGQWDRHLPAFGILCGVAIIREWLDIPSLCKDNSSARDMTLCAGQHTWWRGGVCGMRRRRRRRALSVTAHRQGRTGVQAFAGRDLLRLCLSSSCSSLSLSLSLTNTLYEWFGVAFSLPLGETDRPHHCLQQHSFYIKHAFSPSCLPVWAPPQAP